MKEIELTEFRKKCSALIAEVERTRQPVRIVHRGEVFVEIIPYRKSKGIKSQAPQKQRRKREKPRSRRSL
jgi:prevent-host-death family protein